MPSIWPAALVHLFTACGAVCGLLALRAVGAGQWEAGFAWLGVALFIDGIDGTFARMAHVSDRLPRFSGERLDLIVDYLNYVFVPAYALLAAQFLRGGLGLCLCALILLSSLFHFSDTESKSKDHCFVGFPAVWNIVAFYVFALSLPAWLASSLVLICVGLTFVPMHWAHPLRTRRLFPLTLSLVVLWAAASALTLLWGFPASTLVRLILCLAAAYGVGLALLCSGLPR